MTQPIDIAYVDIVANTKDFARTLDKEITKELKQVEQTATNTTDHIERSFKNAAGAVGQTFKDVNGRLHDAQGRFVKAGEAAGDALTTGLQAAQGAARSFSGTLVGIVTGITQLASSGPAGVALLAAQFVALGAAVTAAAAVIQNLITIAAFGLASLPGLITGVIAGFGVLAVALSGVTEAFEEQVKLSNAAGGAAIDNSRRIADAQRGVLQAQKDLIKAREQELERIQDVRRELIAARTAEKRAADDVLKAEYALQRARAVGTPRAIIEAQLALDEANATLDAARDKTEDLAKDKAKSDKVGVEGSEAVLAAQERLRDAQDALALSQQKVSAGAAAQTQAFDSLTKSAQAFVLALVSAKEQLAPLADAIQEAFFKGTAPLIQPIVDNLLALEPSFVRVSAGFNKIFKEILKFLGSPEAKDALGKVLEGLADFLDAVAPAIGPLLEAFAELAGEGGQFGKILGDLVATGLLKLAEFVKNVDLKQLFEDAKVAVKDLLPLIKPLLSITIDLFKILVDLGNIVLPALAVNFKIIAAVIDFARGAFNLAYGAVVRVFDYLREQVPKIVNSVKNVFNNLPTIVSELGPKLFKAGKDLITQLFAGLGAAGGFLMNIGKDIANSVIGFLNNTVIGSLNTAIRGIQDSLNKLPFFDVTLPQVTKIPKLAKGGVSTQNMLAEISEGNKEEAVIPLENSRALAKVGNAIASAGGVGAGQQINFAAGAVNVIFEGVVPTPAQAFETGKAVADGISRRLAARKSRVAVRTI